jgi:8-oxo-dGTP pyrophosphatase MutT (NUDIX family)
MALELERVRAALTRRPVPRFPPETTVGAAPAAVVLALRFAPARLLVVERAGHLADHAGELGFPGGKPEPGDADLRATAGRELEEECGVGAAGLDWLGELLPCPVITGRYLIHPFVAALPEGAIPSAASGELVRVMDLALEPLLDGSRRYGGSRNIWRGVELVSPHFDLDGALLYGASAAIALDLLSRIAAELGQPLPPPVLQDRPAWGERYGR